jgi:hypothetical protein
LKSFDTSGSYGGEERNISRAAQCLTRIPPGKECDKNLHTIHHGHHVQILTAHVGVPKGRIDRAVSSVSGMDLGD